MFKGDGFEIYYPPEVYTIDIDDDDYEDSKQITYKFDVWSLGAIMIYLFSGERPWKNRSRIIYAILNSPNDIYKRFDPNHVVLPIIKMCCREGAEDRLTEFNDSITEAGGS